jgi:hypothetical protein
MTIKQVRPAPTSDHCGKDETLALPTLTPEQRAQALEKAAAARKQRSELLGKLKDGTTTVQAVLNIKDDQIVIKTRVRQVLEAVPGWGKVKVAQLMEKLEIAESRRVGGLGPRQREALIAEFN